MSKIKNAIKKSYGENEFISVLIILNIMRIVEIIITSYKLMPLYGRIISPLRFFAVYTSVYFSHRYLSRYLKKYTLISPIKIVLHTILLAMLVYMLL